MMVLQSNSLFPDYCDLDEHFSPQAILIPPHGDPNHAAVANAYSRFAKILRTFLLSASTIKQEKAPKAYKYLLTETLEHDGFNLLWIITSCSSPQLGGYARDPESYVKELEMIDGDPPVDFYCRANIMRYEIELQEDTTGQANKLLHRFVSLLSSLADFHQSLESLREHFTLFFRQPNNHRLCFKYTLKEIYEDVIIPKGLVDTIDFTSKFRRAPVTSINLPSPIVNAGKMTSASIKQQNNIQDNRNSTHQRR